MLLVYSIHSAPDAILAPYQHDFPTFLIGEGAQWINGQNIQVDGVSKNWETRKAGLFTISTGISVEHKSHVRIINNMHTIYMMHFLSIVFDGSHGCWQHSMNSTGQFLLVFPVFGVQIIINDLQLLKN